MDPLLHARVGDTSHPLRELHPTRWFPAWLRTKEMKTRLELKLQSAKVSELRSIMTSGCRWRGRWGRVKGEVKGDCGSA